MFFMFTWICHVINQLYPNTKYKVFNKKNLKEKLQRTPYFYLSLQNCVIYHYWKISEIMNAESKKTQLKCLSLRPHSIYTIL